MQCARLSMQLALSYVGPEVHFRKFFWKFDGLGNRRFPEILLEILPLYTGKLAATEKKTTNTDPTHPETFLTTLLQMGGAERSGAAAVTLGYHRHEQTCRGGRGWVSEIAKVRKSCMQLLTCTPGRRRPALASPLQPAVGVHPFFRGRFRESLAIPSAGLGSSWPALKAGVTLHSLLAPACRFGGVS